MDESACRSRTVHLVGLVTALVGLAAAGVSAGLIGRHDPGPGPVLTGTSASSTTAAPTWSTTAAPTWKRDATALCQTAQDAMDTHPQDPAKGPWWSTAAYEGQVFQVMDQALRQIDAPAEVQSRLQLMTRDWDQAADALIRAGAAGDRMDQAQALVELQAYVDPNARGNQVAEDLGISRCATVGIALDTST